MPDFGAHIYGMASPYDELDWGATLDPLLLEAGEAIETVTFALDAADAALGVTLEERPSETDATYGLIGYMLVTIAAEQRAHARWSGRGTIIRPRATIATSMDRIWAAEMPIRIARDVSVGAARAERVLLIGRWS